MIAWFVRNSVAANLLMCIIVLCGGVLAIQDTPIEIFPFTESDTISVTINYPGATPEDVERSILTRIEESLQGVEGVDKITSTAKEGFGIVRVEASRYHSGQRLLSDVKTKVDAISTLPLDAERPIIELQQFVFEVITVIISGAYDEQTISDYAEQIYDEIQQLPGVSQLDLGYVREREINVEISQDTLRQYDLSLEDLALAIERNSIDLSAGNLHTSAGDILIRTRGQAYQKEDFDNIVLRSYADGSILRISDVARVRDAFVDDELHAYLDGKNAAIIAVNRVAQESVIDISKKVKDYIERKQARLPHGMLISYWDDNSKIVRDRLSTLVTNAIQGSILILILLALFLHPRVAFWVFLGLPVSFAGAFIVMWLTNTSINIISLFSFILVLGVVVDDAIVTGENIYRHSAFDASGSEASIKGTKEIAIPVTFGVLTTMVAFLPMAFLEGARSALFAQIPLVVIPALMFSWVESKLILPAHLRDFKELSEAPTGRGLSTWNNFRDSITTGFEHMVLHFYMPLLSKIIRHRYSFIVFFTALLFLCLSLVASGWVRFVFLPRVQSEEVMMQFNMPVGSPYSMSATEVKRATDAATRLQEKYVDPKTGKSVIKQIFSSAGANSGAGLSGNGANASGLVVFELYPPEDARVDIDAKRLLTEWRKAIGPIPGAESVSYRAELGGFEQPLQVQLTGYDLDVLKQAAIDVRDFLMQWDGVSDVADDFSDGKEELRVELLPEGYALGVTHATVTRQVRRAFYGYEAQRVQRGRNDMRVKVRFPLEERRTLDQIYSMDVLLPDGAYTSLRHVARLSFERGPAEIVRINRLRTISISADIDKSSVNMQVLQKSLTSYMENLVSRYQGIRYQYEGEILEQRESLGSLSAGLLFVLVAIYCLLAIPLSSYIQPLIVMSIIPFSFIGVILAHFSLAKELSMMSILGSLALAGVVVNDALVLVDFINKHRGTTRLGILFGIRRACVLRLRPVILTSLTTFIGLMPLFFDNSTQAEFLKPMAISLGFGVLFASAVTLFLVPVAYMVLEDLKGLSRFSLASLQHKSAVDHNTLAGRKASRIRSKI